MKKKTDSLVYDFYFPVNYHVDLVELAKIITHHEEDRTVIRPITKKGTWETLHTSYRASNGLSLEICIKAKASYVAVTCVPKILIDLPYNKGDFDWHYWDLQYKLEIISHSFKIWNPMNSKTRLLQ